MRIVSWNVNGLRSVGRNGHWKGVWALRPDVLCLQEVKAEPDQLPEELLAVSGYTAYFNPSRVRKGHSGVATYVKQKPETVEYGMGIERFDAEGRIITTRFSDFTLCNVYFPNGGMGPERVQYKLDFYDAFLPYMEDLRQQTGKGVILCGDINTAHEEIDLARPRENEKTTGFLPEERAWIDELTAHGYVDVFRHANPERAGAYTYWDYFTRARERNVGWRIDYFFASADLLPKIKNPIIHSDVYGSDHCPISIEVA